MEEIIFTLDVFYHAAFNILLILYVIFGYCLLIGNIKWQFYTYCLGLITLLFYRKSAVGYNFDFYLWDWLDYIFINKIIMINIIGNIIIFIPLGMYNKNIIRGLFIIVLLEILQVVFKRGLFDIVDIFLNTIGYIIGSIEVTLWKKKIKKIN
jgi:glycopeptide antibiotics resistance protein